MAKPIFYDPRRKRWGRGRMLFNVLGLVISALVVCLVVTVFFQPSRLPHLGMPELKRNLRAVKSQSRRKTVAKGTHRKTKAPPSEIVVNADEGIRAAYHVTWYAASFVSLKKYYPQIDILFPEWLHVFDPEGNLQSPNEATLQFRVQENVCVRSH